MGLDPIAVLGRLAHPFRKRGHNSISVFIFDNFSLVFGHESGNIYIEDLALFIADMPVNGFGQFAPIDTNLFDLIRGVDFCQRGARMPFLSLLMRGRFFLFGSLDGGLLLFVLLKFKRLASRVMTSIKISTIDLVPADICLSSPMMACAFSIVP